MAEEVLNASEVARGCEGTGGEGPAKDVRRQLVPGLDALAEDTARAFEAYLRVRPRLPAARFPETWQAVENLGEIAGRFDLVLLDAYGVLNVGETPVPGAARRIAALRAQGVAVMVVSNSAGYPKRRMMQRYATLGFDFAPGEVVTSREALLAELETAPRRRWGVMLAPEPGDDELRRHDVVHLGDDRSDYDRAEGFLLVGSDGWTEARQARLAASLRARPRPVCVGNPDLVAPRELWQQPSDDFLRRAERIHVRRVEEVHPGFHCLANERAALILGQHPVAMPALAGIAIAHAAEAELRNLQPRMSQVYIIHRSAPFMKASVRRRRGWSGR